ncbi:alpha/beta fold hydrolase [Intrasporangium sp.]|uniref:alpha/beta fold hydrolase n=1 Tax=Intrasporangium sp. TaxID=1925024 RepID=UPI00293AADE3|nr:alpha/beta fold hydrolase [Intrasporangium sp.]MDV3219796.1 alpha/beta hydrolase [Intrasporangium sp.]
MRHESRRITTPDGVVLAVYVHTPVGAGPETPTLVLAHGWTLSHRTWTPVVEALADDPVRIVSWDQRGHGGSRKALVRKEARTISIDHLGRDLATVVDTVVPAESPLVLGGHSMGGMTVLSYAAQFPSVVKARVRGVALVSTASHAIPMGARPGETRLMRLLARGLPVIGGPVIRPRSQRAFLFGDVADPRHVKDTVWQVAHTPLTTIGAFYGAISRLDVRTAFAALEDVPVTVLVGSRDKLTPPALSHAIGEGLPHATLKEIPGAGHMLTYEATDTVVDAIRSLL